MIITLPMAEEAQAERELRAARLPLMLGLGLAVPALSRSQSQIEREMAELWSLHGGELARWRRIIAGSNIEKRHGVLAPAEVVHLTTAQRMAAYEQFAPALAEEAASKAMQDSGIKPAQVTDLIVVSCTGFSAPGVDVELIERLRLPRTVRRMMVGFMGCFGAISGLRTAVGTCAAGRDAIALVVCVELCSLHMRADSSAQNQVASALFADGAAAAVLSSSGHSHIGDDSCSEVGRVTAGASLVIPEGKNWMTWRITDAGFAMTLSRHVPAALATHLSAFVESTSLLRPRNFVIHPGGPGILDAAASALGADAEPGIEASRAILRNFGNMSSATILFVLREMTKMSCTLPATLLAFGPGLTIESLQVLPPRRR